MSHFLNLLLAPQRPTNPIPMSKRTEGSGTCDTESSNVASKLLILEAVPWLISAIMPKAKGPEGSAYPPDSVPEKAPPEKGPNSEKAVPMNCPEFVRSRNASNSTKPCVVPPTAKFQTFPAVKPVSTTPNL